MDFDDHPDEEWVDDQNDSEDDLLTCPSCREPVHEDTQQCPHCGDWIIPVYPERPWKRALWLLAAILALIAIIIWAVR
jgi:predicted nucleic acid-binding Zn ribbon protein